MKIYDTMGDPFLNVLLGDYYKVSKIIFFNKLG